MTEILANIKKAVDNGEPKEAIRVLAKQLEKELDAISEFQDIVPPMELIETGDEHLDRAKGSVGLYAQEPMLGLSPAVVVMENNFRNFLTYYNIGSILSFSLVSAVTVEIELSCGVSTSTRSNSKESNAMLAQIQIQTLKEQGIEFAEHVRFKDRYFKVSDKNADIIRDILHGIGAHHIRFESVEDRYGEHITLVFRKVKFAMSVKSLMELKIDGLQVVFDRTSKLNPDESTTVLSAVKKISSALRTAEENADNPGINNIVNAFILDGFVDICDAIELETVLSKRVHERHAAEKRANAEARELETRIGEQMTPEMVKSGYEDLCDTLNRQSRNMVMMYVEPPSINQYGVEIEMRFSDMIVTDGAENIDYQAFYEKTFDITGTFGADMLVKPTDKFYVKIQEFADVIGAKISGVDINVYTHGMGVKSVKMYVNNLRWMAVCNCVE